MATYTEMLAEKIQDVAAANEEHCYHDRNRDDRVQKFTEVIVQFCAKFHIDFYPKEEE